MVSATPLEIDGLEKAYYRMYREFLDQAEKRRRWNVREDIPWDKVNKNMDPAVALIVESFCAVEMFLPDYMGKVLPVYRFSHGRTFFHINWGYEEAKHSLALGDWLLASGARTEEQMDDLERRTTEADWRPTYANPLGTVVYVMVQEMATWLNYRNLRRVVDDTGDGDPALSKLLQFIMVDERCHHDFYARVTELYLKRDRESTLRVLREVLLNFSMPALGLLADSPQREAMIRDMKLFDEGIYFNDVMRPLLDRLGVSWSEFRQRQPGRRSWAATGLKQPVA
jgi:acyl-[acyl-carrier-protein] desaturase